jgi:hypothetical protein
MQGLGELVKAPGDFMEPEIKQAKEEKGNRLIDGDAEDGAIGLDRG